MASQGVRFDKELLDQFQEYRAEVRRQFRRSCLTYAVALVVLLLVSMAATWALGAILLWTVMLASEARFAYGNTESPDSSGFIRWQSRRAWVAAGKGDTSSLKRLQNVQ